MTLLTRRTFLEAVALCSAGVVFGAESKSPLAHFPTNPRARIAVATYPFRASIIAPENHDRDAAKPGMDLAAFGRYIRSEFDVGGIEPLNSHFASTEPDEIRKLRMALDAAGVRTVNIPVDEPVELCSDDVNMRRAGNARYQHWIDTAVRLGSPSIRVWLPKCSDTPGVMMAVEALRPTLSYAAARNIVVNLENDDPVLSSDARVLAALKVADTSFLRALPDFANSLMGGDEGFNAQAVEHMFARAWNIAHVKDAESINGKRETVSLAQLFGIAKAAGYRGYYSMESDSDVDPFADTRHLIRQTLALM
jgi:sugar phosphate isomerase/epimerase